MSRVDVIIPTHNGLDWLARCLDTLKHSSFTDFALWVFDDASQPPVAPVVRDKWRSATVIRSEQNVGLAKGFNAAISVGRAEYVVLLNNDTEVEETWLAALVECADRHPEAGSVASKLRLLSDRRKLHSAGDYYSVRGMPGNRGVWLDDFGQYDRDDQVFGACGGAALYRREALEAVAIGPREYFDERLYMYCEDVDMAWRLRRAGWPCIFAPEAIVYHALSATGGGTLASYFVSRNVWLVLARSVPDGVLLPYRMRIAAYHLGRLVRTLRHIQEPAARASLRGTAAGFLVWCRERGRQPSVDDATQSTLRNLLAGK